ncbi:hypothetical protein GP486_001665 [Trichoglossum hirsutum]|uniref:STB6-like N-terminal domain-containing protein n=1 Tax=Trichoglossum hirsutum TaxID=265104 RepID=A0A9P8RSF3_9PEZI|nr:hypothetical protein GP486_001665 [Trichoglossum hirsutum]
MYDSLSHPDSRLALNPRQIHHSRDPVPIQGSSPIEGASPSTELGGLSTRQKHQRFVFTDPVAFRYLEEDSSTTVLARQSRLEGYELYIVEQWACSRIHPTFVITTFTGDPSHSVVASVLSVPTDEAAWSDRLRVYFNAVSQFHARRKETPLGILMVTNLSGFPSALTVIAVPEGDVKKHREDFIVNENLKRLGCSGRAGLTLSLPTGATKAKFYQLYRTSDRIPLYNAVIELVKLCQMALTVFSKLALEFADGLLCDVTERAINDWWTELGTEFYNLEPNDGILGPTTVAALLGLLMGARNRLNAFGAPVPKDVFDLNWLKRGIAHFQKSQKLDMTRRLDRQTLDRLHRVTAKVASGDGWIVRKAVKSTVAELSGKGGEMVMGMVGAREKAGIGEVETVDIEQFIQLVRGERLKWLWHGKQRKAVPAEVLDKSHEDHRLTVGNYDHGGHTWSGTKRDLIADEGACEIGKKKGAGAGVYTRSSSESAGVFGNPADKEQHLRRTMFKSVTGRMNDARTGLGRIKDAVGISGLRGHHHKQSKDDNMGFDIDGNAIEYSNAQGNYVVPSFGGSAAPLGHTSAQKIDGEVFTQPLKASGERLQKSSDGAQVKDAPLAMLQVPLDDPSESRSRLHFSAEESVSPESIARKDVPELESLSAVKELSTAVSDTFGYQSVYRDDEINDSIVEGERTGLHHRTQSFSRIVSQRFERRNENWWPRHLSFSQAEDAVLVWDEVGWSADNVNEVPDPILKEGMAAEAKRIHEQVLALEDQVIAWVEQKLADVEALDVSARRDQEELHALYYQHLDNYRALRAGSNELLAEERVRLVEAMKDIENLGEQLEYEVNALSAKVEDVEDGVADFERQVLDVEARVGTLEAEEEAREGWFQWTSRFFTGVGIGLGGCTAVVRNIEVKPVLGLIGSAIN